MKQDHSYIAIEIENSRLAPFLDLEKGRAAKNVHLTTMVDNQRRAYIKIFLITPGKKILLKEFDLTSLPPKPAGPPRFVLICSFDGIYSLSIDLQVDGKACGSEKINLKKHLRRRRPWIFAAALAILILAASILLIPRSCGSAVPPPQPARSAAPAVKPAAEEARPPAAKPEPAAQPAGTEPPEPAEPARPTQPAPPQAAADSTPTEAVKPVPVSRELIIYFNPNDARLTEEARGKLEKFSDTISNWEHVSLAVEGHCALSGTEEGRVELSRERAERSADFLRQAGAAGAADISVSWYAGERPVTRDPERQELNRRVVLSARGEEAAPQP
jgi:outer membrane protein OmpA-like peptidoglycan-associated protein